MRAPSVYIDPHQLLSALHFHASSGVLFVFQGTGWCENWPKVRFTSSLIDPNMGQKISWDIYAAILRSSLTHTNRLANGIYKPSVSACERSIEVAIYCWCAHRWDTGIESFFPQVPSWLPGREILLEAGQTTSKVRLLHNLCKTMQKQIRFLPQASHQSIGTPDPIATHQASLWNKISCLQIARRKSMLIKGCIAEQKDTKSSWTTFLPSILWEYGCIIYIYIYHYIHMRHMRHMRLCIWFNAKNHWPNSRAPWRTRWSCR